MKLAFASSEVYPFSKTGGLADVSESLPVALKKRNIDVIVLTPLYPSIDIKKHNIINTGLSFEIFINFKTEKVTVFKTNYKNITVYFFQNQTYFNVKDIYSEHNIELRFGVFCYSIIELCRKLNFKPDIFHINDWQTSLVPVLLKTKYLKDDFFKTTRTLLTIHNLAYQGFFPKETLSKLGITDSIFHFKGIEFYNQVNYLKGGIVFSDYVNTVSPSYAKEILTYEAGRGLDGVLNEKKDKLTGILNGIDYDEWNPETDNSIFFKYFIDNLENKELNKLELQKKLNLSKNTQVPIYAFIGRLTEQKGVVLIKDILKNFEYLNAQVVILGTGDNYFERELYKISTIYRDKISVNFVFNEHFSRQIYAASDFFLMPSLFEPCGISQMISMRYGSIPIARDVGGLKDTVEHQITGFKFTEFNVHNFWEAILESLKIFNKKEKFNIIRRNCMKQDFSWDKSSKLYIELYKKIIKN